MKYIGELRKNQRDSLRELTRGTDLVDRLWNFELELEDVVRQLLLLWEEAEAVYKEEGPHAFFAYYQAAEKNQETDPLRFNVCYEAVKGTHFLNIWKSPEDAKKYVDGRKAFESRPAIFKQLSNIGNPNWKRKVDVRTVWEKANELWDHHGAERYHFKSRAGTGFPQVFLKDIAEAIHADGYGEISLTTIRQCLKQARYKMPPEAHNYRVHLFFK